jgi:hypothetical protein
VAEPIGIAVPSEVGDPEWREQVLARELECRDAGGPLKQCAGYPGGLDGIRDRRPRAAPAG